MPDTDPKLEALRAELAALAKKYDCALLAVAVSPTHTIYTMNVSPTWSCLTLENNHCRFTTKGRSPDEQKKIVHTTVHLIMGLDESTRHLQAQTGALVKMVGSHFDISFAARRTMPPPQG